MKLTTIALFLPLFCSTLFYTTGCKKDGASPPIVTDTVITRPIVSLPEREAKVYVGISNRWHDLSNPANYGKWEYVRAHATGYYTNFIAMWINSYQNFEDPQKSCNDMRAAFTKNGCFFETSLETKVNDDPTGGNNENTDKKYIDMLLAAGFTVDHTSLNYGINTQRVNTLKTYNGKRTCLTLAGPWLVGGDINSNTGDNAQTRNNILATDGMQTDGPLGFWLHNSSDMQDGSYSLVKYAQTNKKIAAVMLSPYDASIADYNAARDFFNVSKACVLGHEDNNASPDLWTIWTYGELPEQPTFPESIINAAGETEPANTLTGVPYWLIKHLNNQPKVEIKDTGNVNSNVTVKINGSNVALAIKKTGSGVIEYTMPITISNEDEPQIEISPIVHAVMAGANKDWDISFKLLDKDVTNEVVYNGGLNCIKDLRISKTNKLVLNVIIKSKNNSPASTSIKLETMSNLTNTKSKKEHYTITVAAL